MYLIYYLLITVYYQYTVYYIAIRPDRILEHDTHATDRIIGRSVIYSVSVTE